MEEVQRRRVSIDHEERVQPLLELGRRDPGVESWLELRRRDAVIDERKDRAEEERSEVRRMAAEIE